MDQDHLFQLLDQFRLETPSYAYADPSARFPLSRPSPPTRSIDERLADAGLVHQYTGCCPTVAVHVLWDFRMGVDATETARVARKHGVTIGSIHPNLFDDPLYRFGSAASPDERARLHAHRHVTACISIARAVGSNLLSIALPDGLRSPGQDDLASRKQRLHGALRQWHDAMPDGMTLLLAYNPPDPALYLTDLADWGMAALVAREAGPNAKVLVHTAHPNLEQIVAWLIDDDLLGGLHFNIHPHPAADPTTAGLDPYATFRLFHEIRNAADLHNRDVSRITYTIDPAPTLQPSIETLIETATTLQALFAKACLVDRPKLLDAQARMDPLAAHQCLRDAYSTDVQPLLAEWRQSHTLPPNPLTAYHAAH